MRSETGYGCLLIVGYKDLVPSLYFPTDCAFSTPEEARKTAAYEAIFSGRMEEKLVVRHQEFTELDLTEVKMEYARRLEGDLRHECRLRNHDLSFNIQPQESWGPCKCPLPFLLASRADLSFLTVRCTVVLELPGRQVPFPAGPPCDTPEHARLEAVLLARRMGIMEEIDPYPTQYRWSEERRQEAEAKLPRTT